MGGVVFLHRRVGALVTKILKYVYIPANLDSVVSEEIQGWVMS
ncbi:hypothetical protein DealDRAFT_1191 [Dethiobacter alkaliphilus AHT 1]|uniref:Uncharacterized protein n=1 Tax=Dethiobacter alkaliphilus AHT 1 TaxID=555088 RepID=C0GFD2_DETAL|nr:hypothetical protein DealDRAFT_1191 [Dethiobacter alkaliphilus AHT 1]